MHLFNYAQHLMAIVFMDSSNCYDEDNHIIMALVWMESINHMEAIVVGLSCF